MSDPVRTARLTLRSFRVDDLPEFATLHADPKAMADLGGSIPYTASRDKLDRHLDGQVRHGISRCHVSDADGFIGYVGICCHDNDHPIGAHAEIGWRLLPRARGKGYATEAARGALQHAFTTTGLTQILAYTAPDNARSQAVIRRLGLTRQTSRDFCEPDPVLGQWHGLVWIARANDWQGHIV